MMIKSRVSLEQRRFVCFHTTKLMRRITSFTHNPLQPRDAPDVVRSTYAGEFRVDNLLGVPEKINIPERYVPEEQVLINCDERFFVVWSTDLMTRWTNARQRKDGPV